MNGTFINACKNTGTFISYKNTIVDNNGRYIDINKTKEKPIISFQNISLPYTFVLYDIDAPRGIFIHWLIANGQTIIDYIPPNPPQKETHRYIFRLYKGTPKDIDIKDTIKKIEDIFYDMKCVDQKFFITNNLG